MVPCGAVPKPRACAWTEPADSMNDPASNATNSFLVICSSFAAILDRDGNLDQVEIRIAHVYRADRSGGSGFHHRALDDRNIHSLQFVDDIVEGHRGNEAQVERARRR